MTEEEIDFYRPMSSTEIQELLALILERMNLVAYRRIEYTGDSVFLREAAEEAK